MDEEVEATKAQAEFSSFSFSRKKQWYFWNKRNYFQLAEKNNNILEIKEIIFNFFFSIIFNGICFKKKNEIEEILEDAENFEIKN